MTDEKSLLRCIVSKSLHTTERLIVFAAYCIVGTAIAGCVGYLGYLGIPKLLDAIGVVYTIIVPMLLSIPLTVYVVAGVVVAIIAYSFIWCIARELTIDDWASDDATFVASVTSVAFAGTSLAFAFAGTSVAFAVAFAAVAFAVAFVVAFATGDYNETALHKIVRFIGAYYHYRKRVTSRKTK